MLENHQTLQYIGAVTDGQHRSSLALIEYFTFMLAQEVKYSFFFISLIVNGEQSIVNN